MSSSNCLAGRKRTWSAANSVVVLSSSDEEDEIIVLSSDDDDHINNEEEKQQDDDEQPGLDTSPLEAQPQVCTAAEAIASLLAIPTGTTAQGVSRSWQPGPSRPNLILSPSPRSSSSANIMGDASDTDGNDSEPPDYLLITHSWLFKGLKATIADLPVSEIKPGDKRIVSRRAIEVLTEYTWIRTTQGQRMANVPFPAVYVPGQPRVWKGIRARSVPLDESSEPPVIIDEHLQRQKAFPWEPTFKVLHAQKLAVPDSPNINFRDVDIVCDATTLATVFTFLSDPDPTKRDAFRLELSSVRKTLFLSIATHRGRGHIDKGSRTHNAIPAWVAPALTTLGTGGHATGPLFLSGNHFRIVRYRLGSLVLVVRTKVDFILDNRSPLQRTEDPPFRGCQYKRYRAVNDEGNGHNLGFETLVKTGKGRGTRPGAAGVTLVRFAEWDCATALAAKMPLLWFGRMPFVLDGVVSHRFEVVEAKLFSARDSYRSWEEQHQAGLKLLAGALDQLKSISHLAGGNCVAIADPGQQCLRLCRPFIMRFPMPESLIQLVWGKDGDPAEAVYASSSESDDESALSQLSGTPSGFSDWTLEAATRPDACLLRAVDKWLKDDGSESDSSEDGDPRSGHGFVAKKDTLACARNPAFSYTLSSFPRMADILDGAVDQDEDEEVEENEEDEYGDDEDDLMDEDSACSDSMSDGDVEMDGEVSKQEDEDGRDEDEFMIGASRSVSVSASSLPSSQTESFAQILDSDAPSSDATLVANDDDDVDHPIPSIEVDEEEL